MLAVMWTEPDFWPGVGIACLLQANFGELVLGCINADFCNQILILQRFSRSTRFAILCTAPNSKISKKIANIFGDFSQKMIIRVFTVLGECGRENTGSADFRDFLDFVTDFLGFSGILGYFYVANIFVWEKKKVDGSCKKVSWARFSLVWDEGGGLLAPAGWGRLAENRYFSLFKSHFFWTRIAGCGFNGKCQKSKGKTCCASGFGQVNKIQFQGVKSTFLRAS